MGQLLRNHFVPFLAVWVLDERSPLHRIKFQVQWEQPEFLLLLTLLLTTFLSGHGLSLLVRAYNYTGDSGYLQCARNALQAYNLSVSQNGVRSLFLNQPSLPWYEEYPTEPGNFVLNGFIYALFGLYDLTQVSFSLYMVQYSVIMCGQENWLVQPADFCRNMLLFSTKLPALLLISHGEAMTYLVLRAILLTQ